MLSRRTVASFCVFVVAGGLCLPLSCGGGGGSTTTQEDQPPITVNSDPSNVRSVEWSLSTDKTSPAWVKRAYTRALGHLSRSDSPANQLAAAGTKSKVQHGTRLTRVVADSLGYIHTRIDQTVDGLPVLGDEIIVETRFNGDLASPLDRAFADVGELNTHPTLTADQAVAKASILAGGTGELLSSPNPQLVVLSSQAQTAGSSSTLPARLCWQVTVLKAVDASKIDFIDDTLWIDAQSGELVSRTKNSIPPVPE